MKIAKGHKVRIEFDLKVKGGEVIESSAKSGPIEYVHGEGKMLPGLEKRLEGMAIGQETKGVIPANEAIPESMLPTKDIAVSEFPKGEKLDVGRVFQAKGPAGEPIAFKVTAVDKTKVTVRFLHPLAGKDLEYRVKVLMIDDPTAKKRAVAVPPPPADALDLKLDEEK
jgi:FKBP-type peptidyl-prolyl cis-trans isomerase SlyD